MFVKPGDSVRFACFYQSSSTGLGVSGLTVYVSVNRGTTNAVTVASNTAASALDATNMPGWYYYDYVVPDGYYGILTAYFTTTDTSVSQRGAASFYISAQWVVYAAQQYRDANIEQISGDAAAAVNLEADYDGTGYAKSASTVGTVTTVTNAVTVSGTVSANVTQISGDTTAADNAESFFDGTGYAGTNNVIPTVTTVTNGVTVTTNNDKTGYSLSGTPNVNVSSIANGAITAAAIATGAIDADALAADAVAEIAAGISVPSATTIADAVWDEATSGHATAGSTGAALTAAGAAGDPLSSAVPGSYASGTAGYILGSLNGVTPTVIDPLNASTGTLTLVYGNEYDSTTALGRLSVPNGITGLDLTAASVTNIKLSFKLLRDVHNTDAAPVLSLDVHSGSLTATVAKFSVSDDNIRALKSNHVYAWSATCLQNGGLVTFNSGTTGTIDWSVNPAT